MNKLEKIIDLTNLCYYDKRNPDCSVDEEDIEAHKKSLLRKKKTCSCDNCFYGRTELTEVLIKQEEITTDIAIKFAEWIADTKIHGYSKQLYEAIIIHKVKTTEELFQKFINNHYGTNNKSM